MKIGLLISIRDKSNRLPGKVLMKIIGQSVTEHLIDRMKLVQGFDKIVLATSDDPRDKIFEKMAKIKGVEIFYGSQEDKLLRYSQICSYYNFDAVVIVDGDDILVFPELISETINYLKSEKYDVIFWKGLPLGAASSGLTKMALEKVMLIKDESDTEVWGGYFTNDRFNILYATASKDLFNHPEIRLTLDYQEDYDLFNVIFNEFKDYGNLFSSEELMDLLVYKKPNLCDINRSVQILYEENLKKAAKVKFK